MRVIDFRRGGWGHTMHGWTWKVIEPRYVVTDSFWKRTTTQHPRVSVMVHTPRVSEGDTVIYTGQSGNDREATVAEVRPCWDPRDMFTLILEDIREHPAPLAESEGSREDQNNPLTTTTGEAR